MILVRLAILISARSDEYYYRKAVRRDRLLSAMLAGAVGYLNLTRAVDKLQSSLAHQSIGNDLLHSTGSARVCRDSCIMSYIRNTV